ncbi:MAG: glycosyltransferase family 9 protein [Bacteroidales bacterium]
MKILLLRFSSIGDIVLTTPVIRCVGQQLPATEVHFLTRSSYAPLLAHNPHIQKLWLFDKDISEVLKGLRRENFDFIADLHCNWRSKRLRWALRRPSAGFPKLNVRKWLLVNTKINLMPPLHVVDRYFKAVARLGVVNDGKGLEIFIPENEKLDLNQLPETFHAGFIALAIGARHFTKQIPESLAIQLIRQLPLPVLLLGGAEDYAKAENIVQQVGSRVFNACGKLSLLQSADALQKSELVITGDTGLMHLAAALRKKTITLWGNTVPAFGMSAYQPGTEYHLLNAEVEGLSCRPCSKLGHPRCPRGHFKCMEDQNVNHIAQKASEWLNAK